MGAWRPGPLWSTFAGAQWRDVGPGTLDQNKARYTVTYTVNHGRAVKLLVGRAGLEPATKGL